MRFRIASVTLFLACATDLFAQQPRDCQDGGPPRGDLGIVRLRCVGVGAACAIGVPVEGGGSTHRFSVEPVVTEVSKGIAAPLVATGDVIVAIDSLLITTAAGGARLANLTPDATVRLLVRRDGQLRELRMTPGRGCGVTGLSVRWAKAP